MTFFKVNDSISLSLIGKQTIIYVNKVEFMQCKSILLDIPANTTHSLNEVDSIDEAYEISKRLDTSKSVSKYQITPREEFWGHCSNLQTWVEHDYDTRLLHSDLAFPLLKRLSEVGDVKALRMFKHEIITRFIEGSNNTKEFLIYEGYIDYLSEEEIRCILPIEEMLALENIEETFQIKFSMANDIEYITGVDIEPENLYFIEDFKISALKMDTTSEQFPEGIIKLKNLKNLVLSYNSFRFISPSIGNLLCLETIDLAGNCIKTIPESFKFLKNLERLDLASNKLTQIPPFIDELTSLKKLYLEGNCISVFPDTLGDLKKKINHNSYFKPIKDFNQT